MHENEGETVEQAPETSQAQAPEPAAQGARRGLTLGMRARVRVTRREYGDGPQQ